MSPGTRRRGSFWQTWQQTIVLAGVFVATQCFCTWLVIYVVAPRDPPLDSGELGMAVLGQGPMQAMPGQLPLQAGASRGVRPAKPGQNAMAAAAPQAAAGSASASAPSMGSSPSASGDAALSSGDDSAIVKLDKMLAKRLKVLAKSQDRDHAALMPPADLRTAAIQSGSIGSEASQALIEAYSTTFQDLGFSMGVE